MTFTQEIKVIHHDPTIKENIEKEIDMFLKHLETHYGQRVEESRKTALEITV